MIHWLLSQETWVAVSIWVALGLAAAALLAWVVRAGWRSVDPPYEAVRRRPRELKPWHVDPVTDRTAFIRDTEPARRSLDRAWRERVLEAQPTAPARHRVEHHEETRAWDPEELRRRLEERGRG